MAEYRLPGPTCAWSQSLLVDNGSSALGAGCPRGPVDGAAAGHASEFDPRTLWRRAAAVREACSIGLARAPQAIVRETGLDDLPALAKGLLEGALAMLAGVGASAALGGTVGGAVGAVLGGVGAVPGAVVGAQFGMDAGVAVLGWIGLGFLAVAIGRGLGEVSGMAVRAVGQAWAAEGTAQRSEDVEAAGQWLADAVGRLMRVIVMAVVARLAAAQTVGATARASATAEELYAALRQSRLGAGFADWVAANAERLLGNPRLRMHNEVGGTGGKGVERVTPSQLLKVSGETPAGEVQGANSSARRLGLGADEVGNRGAPVNGAIRSVPFGFENEPQFLSAARELQDALKASGIDDAIVGVRGSSVTGQSLTKGTPFGPESDIDFFVESSKLTEGYKVSKNIPGFVHPNKILPDYPLLEKWAEKWSKVLGREITPGAFRPGMLPNQPAILVK